MSSTTHAYLHFAFGARYLSGLAPNGIIPDASGNLATSAQFGIDSGAITDEDIYLAYAGIGSTVGLPIFYLILVWKGEESVIQHASKNRSI